MGRPIAKLSALKVEQLSKRIGAHGDGGGLWLYVSSKAATSWIFRFAAPSPYWVVKRGNRVERPAGTQREMGLGSYPAVTLAGARERAVELRKELAAGRDPLAVRAERKAAEGIRVASAITFRDAAERYIEAHQSSWKNDKHGKQWRSTLKAHAFPLIGALPVQAIDVTQVARVLEPIWGQIPETASRVRGRLEAVIDWATARGYRNGENPARWRGHLENLFPHKSSLKPVKHHAALPYGEIAVFLTALDAQPGTAARALRFAILTAARTSEVLGATVGEFDMDKSVWTIPAARMKAGREHRVPLSSAALEVLGTPGDAGFAFPGRESGRGLSNMAFLQLLKRMGRPDLTAHGFRSTFRDWAGEMTTFPREIAEAALAHSVGDSTERAYRRGDALAKRRELMEGWATHCTDPAPCKVISIRTAAL